MGADTCNCSKHQEEQVISLSQSQIPDNSKIGTSLRSRNKNDSYNDFKRRFDENLIFIGNYIEPYELNQLIPDYARNYMTEECLDPSKYLKTSRPTYEIKPVKFENGNIYHGSWNEDFKMEGAGKYYLADVPLFLEGVWDDGILIYGRVFLPNGDIYEGQIQNSSFTGEGKMTLANGEKYIGGFLNGERNGKGKYIFPDGVEYEGDFVRGIFDGDGTMYWPGGTKYEGRFTGPMLNGYGVLTNNDGEKYEGEFSINQFNGKGRYSFANGNIYEGGFENGQKNGKGIYKTKDGFYYDGEWSHDKPNGFGKINYDGKEIKAVWRNGKLSEEPKDDLWSFQKKKMEFEADSFILDPKKLPHLKDVSAPNNRELPSFLNENNYY